jgi:antitoxin VapB
MLYISAVYHGDPPMATAKVFWSGRSQAVRLPKEFRLDSDEVRIRREGKKIILEPIPKDWAWLDELQKRIGQLDDDFIAAVNEELPMQERPELDDLFK